MRFHFKLFTEFRTSKYWKMGVGAHTPGYSVSCLGSRVMLTLAHGTLGCVWKEGCAWRRGASALGSVRSLLLHSFDSLGAQGSSRGCGAVDCGGSLSAPDVCRAIALIAQLCLSPVGTVVLLLDHYLPGPDHFHFPLFSFFDSILPFYKSTLSIFQIQILGFRMRRC